MGAVGDPGTGSGGHGADSVFITAHPGLLQLLSLFLSACAPAWLSHSAIHPQPWALPAVHGAQDGWMDEEISCWCWAGLSVRR